MGGSPTGLLDQVLADPYPWLGLALGPSLHPGGEQATRDLLEQAGVEDGTRLLDAGCGAGASLKVARELGAEATGMDARPGNGAVCGDLGSLPFEANVFDVVLAECVVCLADDAGGALEEIRRVLGPGGRLAMSDVTVEGDIEGVPAPLATALCLDGDRRLTHLVGLVEGSGFEIQHREDRSEDIAAMRDELTDRVDVEGLLAALPGTADPLAGAVETLEAALDEGRIGYTAIVATPARRSASR